MRAAVLVRSNEALELADLELPALGVGQVLVKIKYSGICGSQLNEIDAAKGPDLFLPHCLGHEAVGTVLEIGAGVKHVAVDDRVVLHWRQGLGIQSDPPVYSWNGRRVNAGWVTTFQEQAVVSENRLTKLPDGVDERTAPLYGCSLTTSYGVITRDVQIKPGDSVMVVGCGGVGRAIIDMLRLVSAEVTAVDPVESKRLIGDYYSNSIVNHLGEDYDVIIDTTGKSSVLHLACDVLDSGSNPAGTIIQVGVPNHDDPITVDALPLHFGRVIKGSHGGDALPHKDIPKIASLVRRGKLNLDGLVTHEFQLEQINEAIAVVRSGSAGRVLIRMNA